MMNKATEKLKELLPSPLYACLEGDLPEELRLKRGAPILTKKDGQLTINRLICTNDLFDETFSRLTNRSYYSYADGIKDGYLSLPCGIRVGVAGTAVTAGGRISSVKDLSFLCIRVPRPLPGAADRLFSLLGEGLTAGGAIVYSPPGVGKTTLLRELARRFASPPRLIPTALIDERGELSFDLDLCPSLTVYLHYPKEAAIEIALRTVSPAAIFTDEIGAGEADALLSCASGGVPVFASAHADSFAALTEKPGMRRLLLCGCFQYCIGLRRRGGSFSFDVRSRKDF